MIDILNFRAILDFPPPRAPRRALSDALKQINVEFSEAAAIRLRKKQLRYYLQLGTGHPAFRARYGARAARLSDYSIEAAICLTERWYREERKSFQIAAAFGTAPGRLSLEVLRELHLLLRFLRRSDQRDFLSAYTKLLTS